MALRLELDPSGIVTGAAKANAAITGIGSSADTAQVALKELGQGTAAGMAKVEAATTAAAASALQFASAQNAAVGAARSNAAYTGNIAAQFNDIGQMMAAGQSPFMLAIQQGTQLAQVLDQAGASGANTFDVLKDAIVGLLSGTTMITIALIAGATYLLQWGAAALFAGDEAETAAEKLERFEDALSGYISYAQTATSSTANLQEQFGEFANQIRQHAAFLANVQVSAAMRELTSGNLEFSESLAEVSSKQKDFIAAEAQYAAAVAGVRNGTVTPEFRMVVEDNLKMMADDADAAASSLGLTGAEVRNLNTALTALSTDSGGGMKEINADATAVNALLVQMTNNGQKISPELQALAEKMFDLEKATAQALDLQAQMPAALSGATSAADGFSGALSRAVGNAATLAGNLWNAYSASAAIQRNRIGTPDAPAGIGNLAEQYAQYGAGRTAATALTNPLYNPPAPPVVASNDGPTGPTGTSGAVAIDRTRDAFDRLLGTLDPIVATQQKMAAAQKTVNDALAAGTITAADSANAMAMIAEEYSTAADAMASFKSAGADAFDSLISGTASLQDAIKSLIDDMVLAIAKQTLLGSVKGGTADMSIGGLLVQGISAGFGGFFDKGGMIANGQTGVVGEYGPELVKATGGGAMVTSRVDTARMSQGGLSGNIQIGVTVDDEGKIKAMVRSSSIQAARQGASDAVSAVRRNLSSWQGQIERDGALA